MDSESQAAVILSQIETRVADLERTVQSFELAVDQIERSMDELEQPFKSQNNQDDASLQLLTQTLQKSHSIAPLVHAANTLLNDTLIQAEIVVQANNTTESIEPLASGSQICTGKYRLVRVLHSRPRVNLYLAQRQYEIPGATLAEQSLVVVREIVLTGLPQETRQYIVRAAFEEFASPQIFGSPHLPGVGDHLYVENERHYLIMQPRPTRGSRPSNALTLAELLPDTSQRPPWTDLFTGLRLGIVLCQTVARLHRLQIIFGELTPEMILVSREGDVEWAPLLLAAWPPARSFWPEHTSQETQHVQIFPPSVEAPVVTHSAANGARAFAAPEIFAGQGDKRSDIYSLGAILYLLFTGSTPAAAQQRLQAAQIEKQMSGEHQIERRSRKGTRRHRPQPGAPQTPGNLALTPPRVLNARISPLLEQILLRSLALNPQERFTSALDLADALEGMYFRADTPAAPTIMPQAKVSRLRRLLEWLKK